MLDSTLANRANGNTSINDIFITGLGDEFVFECSVCDDVGCPVCEPPPPPDCADCDDAGCCECPDHGICPECDPTHRLMGLVYPTATDAVGNYFAANSGGFRHDSRLTAWSGDAQVVIGGTGRTPVVINNGSIVGGWRSVGPADVDAGITVDTATAFQIQFKTTGYTGIQFSATQKSTGSGPESFALAYSIGNPEGPFTPIADSKRDVSRDPATNAYSDLRPSYTNFALPAALNNQNEVYLRVYMVDSALANRQNGNTSINDIFITGEGSGVFPALPAITTTSLPSVNAGASYNQTLQGNDVDTWAIASGALPPGLSLNASTGAITGTAAKAGTFTFTAEATNADGSVTRELFIRVIRGNTAINRVTPNTFSPTDVRAGSTFAVLPSGNGWFALLAEDNPSLPHNVRCHIGDGEITAMVPSGVDLSALTVQFDLNRQGVSINGVTLRPGDTVDARKPVTVMAGGTPMTLRIETLNTGLPSVSITSRGNTPHEILGHINGTRFTPDDHRVRHPVYFHIGGGDSRFYKHAMDDEWIKLEADIRGRGNSSWHAPKRQYNLRLRERDSEGRRERELLGMAASARWVLQANWEDKTLMRNHLGQWMAAEIGMDYSCDVRFVDIWFNGEYRGAYYLMERVDVEPYRINITTFEEAYAQNPNFRPHEVGYLLEFDQRAWVDPENPPSHRAHIPLVDISGAVGASWVYYDPYLEDVIFWTHADKWAIISEPGYDVLEDRPDCILYIVNRVRGAAEALGTPGYNVYANPARIRNLLDLESFVQWYIVMELMNNTDSSMHSSVNIYLPAGGSSKLTLGPVWDFDRSSGNCEYWNFNPDPRQESPSYLYHSGAGWFLYLFNALPEARELLKSEWARFNEILSHPLTGADATILRWAEELSVSQKWNFERWAERTGGGLNDRAGANPEWNRNWTYTDHVNNLRSYITSGGRL
jgi:hypothetical protein